MSQLESLLAEARACEVCTDSLPHGCRPVMAAAPSARIVVIGQAPGSKVHASGVPWDDDSGQRLREWMQISKTDFYNPALVAILPMGFCYPGKGKSGDLPPRTECAPLWHQRILDCLPPDRLLILAGQYAQAAYLGKRKHRTLTETVRHFQDFLPEILPLPHPAWRSRMFMSRNPWFDADILPVLRQKIAERLGMACPA
jgi:uracil-DNA glycosylase